MTVVSFVTLVVQKKMNLDAEDESSIPMEILEAAESARSEVLPAKSKKIYEKAYKTFKNWQISKKSTKMSESVLLAYLHELGQKMKPSSLWAQFSMLKATIQSKENISITSYREVIAFLKSKAKGFQSVQARIFTEREIQRFIDEAPDVDWLDVKVCVIKN